MDEHVPRSITKGLGRRGVDVLTVQADQQGGSDDVTVLSRATALGRAVVSNDADFQVEAARRQRSGESFVGIVIVDLNRVTIGQCMHDLELIAFAGEAADLANRVVYLPL